MAKRFSELGIKQQDSRKIFNCQQVSITDILNYEIEVIDFLPDVKTQHGEGRYLVHYRMEDGDEVSYTYNGVTSTYRYINATATRGHAPTETLYWQVITEEEQIAALSFEWKPVDMIDQSQIEAAEEGYIIIPVPYDGGDHIGYNYVLRRDTQSIEAEIQALKDSLADSDYKVIKVAEATAVGAECPYTEEELAALRTEREAARAEINALQAKYKL